MSLMSFVVYCIIVTFSPGPANAVIVGIVQKKGSFAGMRYANGVGLGFVLLILLSLMLNRRLEGILPVALPVLRALGALYMLYLAYLMAFSGKSKATVDISATLRDGLLMAFVNPKMIVFAMTVLPTYIMPYVNSRFQTIGYTALICVIGVLSLYAWVLFGQVIQRYFSRYSRVIGGVLAVFMVYSAVMVSGVV